MDRLTNFDLRGMRPKLYMNDPAALLRMDNHEKARVSKVITHFYKTLASVKPGPIGYTIGLSGGIDSALVATLAVKAVGNENVHGMLLPSYFTTKDSIVLAENLAKKLQISYEILDADLFEKCIAADMRWLNIDPNDKSYKNLVRIGNLHARQRMKGLRDHNWLRGYAVLGTSNATERMLGYATIAGDGTGGVDNEGIDGLFKTQVWDLAAYQEVDSRIIERTPSAELWAGQTDEGELGMDYKTIDKILLGIVLGFSQEEVLQATGVRLDLIERIYRMVEGAQFKSKPAPVCKLEEPKRILAPTQYDLRIANGL